VHGLRHPSTSGTASTPGSRRRPGVALIIRVPIRLAAEVNGASPTLLPQPAVAMKRQLAPSCPIGKQRGCRCGGRRDWTRGSVPQVTSGRPNGSLAPLRQHRLWSDAEGCLARMHQWTRCGVTSLP